VLAAGFLRLHRQPARAGLLLLCLSFWVAGSLACSGAYLRNRWKDTGDMFTGTVETRSYGVATRLGPIKAGLNYKSEQGGERGLRGGETGRHYSANFTAFFFGADYFHDEAIRFDDWKPEPAPDSESDDEDAFDTDTDAAQDAPGADAGQVATDDAPAPSVEPLLRMRGKLYHALSPLGTEQPAHKSRSLLKDETTDWAPAYYFTQIELQLGLYLGIRLGWNFGETIDFLAGWFGFDPLDDDEPYADSLEQELEKMPYWQLLDEEAKEEIRKQLREGGGLPVSPF
jgi:hypothetical protein